MTAFDCTKLPGRLRAICEGRSGLPSEVEEQYRQAWAKEWPLDPPRFRLGDWLAWLIRVVTFGRMNETPGCGCQGRRERLNRWWDRLAARLTES